LFNDGGSTGGDAGLTFDKTGNKVKIGDQHQLELGKFTSTQKTALTGISTGALIYDTNSSSIEAYGPEGWVEIKSLAGLSATGGTESTPGDGKRHHTFTSPGNFVVSSGQATVTVQMVGAGGGGSSGNGQWAGGGGGGGYAYASKTVTPGTYSVIRGTGASRQSSCGGNGNSGTNSTVFGWTAYGGGGATQPATGGGGGSYSVPGGTDLGSGSGDPGGGQGGDGSGEGGDNGRRYADSTFTTWGGGAAGVPNYSPGPDASGYGNGGAGGHSCQNGHNGGGAGSPGIVVISYPI
jgi:hypothetical protein